VIDIPAPTASDGFSRAVVEMAAPSVGVFLTVIFTKEFIGGLTAAIFIRIATSQNIGIFATWGAFSQPRWFCFS
jgi:hypothetical protein